MEPKTRVLPRRPYPAFATRGLGVRAFNDHLDGLAARADAGELVSYADMDDAEFRAFLCRQYPAMSA